MYVFDPTAPANSRKALALVREALATRKAVISHQVVEEFFHVAMTGFAKPFSPRE